MKSTRADRSSGAAKKKAHRSTGVTGEALPRGRFQPCQLTCNILVIVAAMPAHPPQHCHIVPPSVEPSAATSVSLRLFQAVPERSARCVSAPRPPAPTTKPQTSHHATTTNYYYYYYYSCPTTKPQTSHHATLLNTAPRINQPTDWDSWSLATATLQSLDVDEPPPVPSFQTSSTAACYSAAHLSEAQHRPLATIAQ